MARSTRRPADDGFVRVRGASEHNLRHVDVDLPRDALVVFTGISGSGKSSLAFGTILAEAQRRYFESIAPYARRLLSQGGVPHVEEITGLPPAVALQQRRSVASSRSSVGTVTTLSNSLRMLFSRAGTYPDGATEVLDSDWFSPNTAVGACRTCHGLGTVHGVTERTLVPDPSLTIRERAIAAWPTAWHGQNLVDILITLGYDVDTPWRKLPKSARRWILFTDEQPRVDIDPDIAPVTAEYTYTGTFSSAERHVMHTLNSKSAMMRERAMRYVETVVCPTCHGARLRPEALAVTFAGMDIARMAALPLTRVAEVLRSTASIEHPDVAVLSARSGETTEVAVQIAADLCERIDVLIGLGLGYLSIGRTTTTLSAGELQRLRIATQLRSGLFGVLYVLDEPSAGLHPADAEPLLDVLARLQDGGNSLFVVEHDMSVVRRADWVVDVGPGAGEAGGHVLYSGPVAGLADVEESVTRRFLFRPRGKRAARIPREPVGWVQLEHVDRNNLQDVDVAFPTGVMTAVTGVSGSGKTSLVTGELAETAPFDRVVVVDQQPIGRTPRSNLATYTGLFDAVRRAFASTPEAQARGWAPGRFSFNVPGGRCETCEGEGFVEVELLFLPGTHGPCPACHGRRYEPETLEVRYRGRSVADVLALTVDEAVEVLDDLPAAARSLATLVDVGLGYLRLGQPATEFSGGEAQRIKLASELQRLRRGDTLYLLDEPTSGLHPADVDLLLGQLHRLVDAGNTVVVVEHDLDVVASADWIIDLGPGAGDEGGRVVVAGPPEAVVASAGSRTAPYLAQHLTGRTGRPR